MTVEEFKRKCKCAADDCGLTAEDVNTVSGNIKAGDKPTVGFEFSKVEKVLKFLITVWPLIADLLKEETK